MKSLYILLNKCVKTNIFFLGGMRLACEGGDEVLLLPLLFFCNKYINQNPLNNVTYKILSEEICIVKTVVVRNNFASYANWP